MKSIMKVIMPLPLLLAAAAPLWSQTGVVPAADKKPSLLERLSGGGLAPERLNALFTGSAPERGEAAVVLADASADQQPKKEPPKKEGVVEHAQRVERETRENPPNVKEILRKDKSTSVDGGKKPTADEISIGGKG